MLLLRLCGPALQSGVASVTPSSHWRPRFLLLAVGVAAIVGILATVPGCDQPSDQMFACASLCGGHARSYEIIYRNYIGPVPVCICAPFPDGGSR